MKKLIVCVLLLLAAAGLGAQVTVTVVGVDGSSRTMAVDATGEVFFGTDYVAVMSSASTGQTERFDMDEVSKMLFSGSVRVTDVRGMTSLRLSPNPATERFVVHGVGEGGQSLSVYDVRGRQVMQTVCGEGETVDVGMLAGGIYFVRVGERFAKLVVRRQE